MTTVPIDISKPQRLLLVLTVIVTVCAGLVSTVEPAAAAEYRTTANLNLRSGPGTTFAVIRTIPSGATVNVTGDAENGFLPVTYSGSSGYASASFLTAGSGSDTGSGTTAGPTGTRYVLNGRLNLRSGPGTTYSVVLVLQDGSSVQLTGEVSGSFSKVTYNGTTGWVATQYLSESSGSTTPTPTATATSDGGSVGVGDVMMGTAITTARLNLRGGPGTGYASILTMPSGATVDVMGASQSGFLPVRYNGTKGWASAQYLSTGSVSTPTATATTTPGDGGSVAIGDTVTGSATTTARLNLRRGPGTGYAVVLTMSSGATVDVMGTAQNGFTPVRYNGTKGWASSQYLTTGGATDPDDDDNGNGAYENMVTTRSVNLRSAPTTSSSVVWVLPPGTLIEVTGAPQNGFYPANWAHVSGFVSGDYLVAESQWTDPGGGSTRDQQMIAIIYQAADKWGQSRVDMLRVARCESALDPNAVNPSSGTSGLFQFRPSTFAITPNGKRGENIFDPWSNADAAGWMWANGMRNHWACQ